MALSINILNNESINNSDIKTILSNQTPIDFALSYLERLDDLYSFLKGENYTNYSDFYTKTKYRIETFDNALSLNNYISATRFQDIVSYKFDNTLVYFDSTLITFDNI